MSRSQTVGRRRRRRWAGGREWITVRMGQSYPQSRSVHIYIIQTDADVSIIRIYSGSNSVTAGLWREHVILYSAACVGVWVSGWVGEWSVSSYCHPEGFATFHAPPTSLSSSIYQLGSDIKFAAWDKTFLEEHNSRYRPTIKFPAGMIHHCNTSHDSRISVFFE